MCYPRSSYSRQRTTRVLKPPRLPFQRPNIYQDDDKQKEAWVLLTDSLGIILCFISYDYFRKPITIQQSHFVCIA